MNGENLECTRLRRNVKYINWAATRHFELNSRPFGPRGGLGISSDPLNTPLCRMTPRVEKSCFARVFDVPCSFTIPVYTTKRRLWNTFFLYTHVYRRDGRGEMRARKTYATRDRIRTDRSNDRVRVRVVYRNINGKIVCFSFPALLPRPRRTYVPWRTRPYGGQQTKSWTINKLCLKLYLASH